MKIKHFKLIILATLLSCGFNVKLNLELAGVSGAAQSNSPKGVRVGSVTLTGLNCKKKSFSLLDNKDGYFEINKYGEILLAKSNPVPGSYNLPVKGFCDDLSALITVNVIINGSSIPLTGPWITHFGATTTGFVGGSNSGTDQCEDVTVDSQGYVYCAGYTDGSFGESAGGNGDALVIKLNPYGDVVWVTQLGANTLGFAGGDNSQFDFCASIDVDSDGNVYCAGQTTGSLGEAFGGGTGDAFIMKLNSSGDVLWVRQMGAVTLGFAGGDNSQYDYCAGVSVDNVGNVYCAGQTTGALGEANGGSRDAFIMKVDSSGNLVWVRQFGANTLGFAGGDNSRGDECRDVAVDNSGNVYCGGWTRGAIGEANGGSSTDDAFVVKLDPSGNLIWATQLGATTLGFVGGNNSSNGYCTSLSVDNLGNVYCAGETRESLGEANGGQDDLFVMKLDPLGNITWVRQLGATTVGFVGGDNSARDECLSVSFDSNGNVFCAGFTDGDLGEVNGGGGSDAFVLKLDSGGNLDWITQFGAATLAFIGGNNSGRDFCAGIAVDNIGNVYCAGQTNGALGEANGGGRDAFVLKLNPDGSL